MSAWDNGHEQGFTYLDSHADVTLSQYHTEGKRRGEVLYVKRDRQAAFLEGWLCAADIYEEDWEEQITSFFHNWFARREQQKAGE